MALLELGREEESLVARSLRMTTKGDHTSKKLSRGRTKAQAKAGADSKARDKSGRESHAKR
jgi:hypothetical protein